MKKTAQLACIFLFPCYVLSQPQTIRKSPPNTNIRTKIQRDHPLMVIINHGNYPRNLILEFYKLASDHSVRLLLANPESDVIKNLSKSVQSMHGSNIHWILLGNRSTPLASGNQNLSPSDIEALFISHGFYNVLNESIQFATNNPQNLVANIHALHLIINALNNYLLWDNSPQAGDSNFQKPKKILLTHLNSTLQQIISTSGWDIKSFEILTALKKLNAYTDFKNQSFPHLQKIIGDQLINQSTGINSINLYAFLSTYTQNSILIEIISSNLDHNISLNLDMSKELANIIKSEAEKRNSWSTIATALFFILEDFSKNKLARLIPLGIDYNTLKTNLASEFWERSGKLIAESAARADKIDELFTILKSLDKTWNYQRIANDVRLFMSEAQIQRYGTILNTFSTHTPIDAIPSSNKGKTSIFYSKIDDSTMRKTQAKLLDRGIDIEVRAMDVAWGNYLNISKDAPEWVAVSKHGEILSRSFNVHDILGLYDTFHSDDSVSLEAMFNSCKKCNPDNLLRYATSVFKMFNLTSMKSNADTNNLLSEHIMHLSELTNRYITAGKVSHLSVNILTNGFSMMLSSSPNNQKLNNLLKNLLKHTETVLKKCPDSALLWNSWFKANNALGQNSLPLFGKSLQNIKLGLFPYPPVETINSNFIALSQIKPDGSMLEYILNDIEEGLEYTTNIKNNQNLSDLITSAINFVATPATKQEPKQETILSILNRAKIIGFNLDIDIIKKINSSPVAPEWLKQSINELFVNQSIQ